MKHCVGSDEAYVRQPLNIIKLVWPEKVILSGGQIEMLNECDKWLEFRWGATFKFK